MVNLWILFVTGFMKGFDTSFRQLIDVDLHTTRQQLADCEGRIFDRMNSSGM